jgi:uncharacterized protein (TIGR02996 family)
MTPVNALQGFFQAVVEKPADESTYLVLADWLEENDDPRRAELLRLHRRMLATCCEPERHPERASWQARVVELLGQGVKPCAPRRTVGLSEGVEMVLSFIPPGCFLMGRPQRESGKEHEVPQHRVTLTKGFFMGAHPVTQAQWQAVLGSDPSRFKGDDLPVDNTSWEDCQELCRKLGERDGRKYRLPTEAEWEHACCAGTTTEYCSGNGEQALKGVSWYFTGTEAGTRPVGLKSPIAWGLYDMHGNVWEWCLDGPRTYGPGDLEDPVGPQSDDDIWVRRGGFWGAGPVACRSACRNLDPLSLTIQFFGCRVVLSLE